MSYRKSRGSVGAQRLATIMESYSAIVGGVVLLIAIYEVGYYLVNGNYGLPHPDLKADFGTMIGQALLYRGLPFAIAFAPGSVVEIVRGAKRLDMAFVYAIIGTLVMGVVLTIVLGISLFLVNYPLSLIGLILHLVLGAFANSAAYGVIVTIFFICIGAGIFGVTAGPAVYRVIIIIFKADD